MALVEKKNGEIAESEAEQVQSHEKNPESLTSEQKLENKSSKQKLKQSEEAETSFKGKKKDLNGRKRKKEDKQDGTRKREPEIKKLKDEKEEKIMRNQHSDKRIGGIIFMCNAKTKPDCFHYRLMGVSGSKQELVMGIQPGLKLFLFDFDLKLMYGVYEASSKGGMKLEPKAFGGGFPAQVYFRIVKDCLPLPEGVFKKAIKENYDERTRKFKTELTVEQVKRLTELFRPAPWLQSNAKSSVQEYFPAPVVQTRPASTFSREETLSEQLYRGRENSMLHQGPVPLDRDDHHMTPNVACTPRPLFLTEREYRSYGLQSGRNLLPIAASSGAPTGHELDNYRADRVKDQFRSNRTPADVNETMVQKETGRSDLLFLSEKEYRTYGLNGGQESHTRTNPTAEANCLFEDPVKGAYNPYDDNTTSLVNRYLPPSRTESIPAESYYLNGGRTYTNNASYIQERRVNPDGGRPYSSYASDSVLDQNYQRLGDEPSFTSSTVSSRYAFTGPSMSRR